MPKPGDVRLYLELEVHDPGGRRRFYRKYRSRSFLRNFLRAIFGYFSSTHMVGTWQITDEGGINVDAVNTIDNQANSVLTGLTVGIGSGSTAPAVTDYDYETEIAEATAPTRSDESSGGTVAYRFTFTLTNNSGGTWSVNEVGLKSTINYGATNGVVVMLIRDVLGSTVSVLDGQAITVRYTIQTTI